MHHKSKFKNWKKKKPNNLTGQVDAMLREYGETGVYNHIKRESMARLEYTITLSTSYRIKLALFSLQAHRLDHLHQKKKKKTQENEERKPHDYTLNLWFLVAGSKSAKWCVIPTLKRQYDRGVSSSTSTWGYYQLNHQKLDIPSPYTAKVLRWCTSFYIYGRPDAGKIYLNSSSSSFPERRMKDWRVKTNKKRKFCRYIIYAERKKKLIKKNTRH